MYNPGMTPAPRFKEGLGGQDPPRYLTKTDQAVEALRGAIRIGSIRPGEWIRVEEWAEHLGLSATPLREALRRLEAEHVVAMHAHRGAQVTMLSEREFAEIYRIRGVLEPLALELAVAKLDAVGWRTISDELSVVQERYHQAAVDRDIEGARSLNQEFHLTLYDEARSPRLSSLISSMWMLLPFGTLHLDPDRLTTSASEHDELLEAIAEGHAARASLPAERSHPGISLQRLGPRSGQRRILLFCRGHSLTERRGGEGFLSQYRVLELGDCAGMFCGKLLGDLGCEVIRIEPPAGDELRRERPLVNWRGSEVSAAWLAYNTSKRSLSLDIEAGEIQSLIDSLIDECDAVVVSGSAKWIRTHGLSPSELRSRRERLVVATITPFGMDGPYADYTITDLVAQSAGGVIYVNGDRDRPPVRISEEQTWAQVGSQTAFVLLAALFAVGASGTGEGIDMSIHEAIVATLMSTVPSWQFGGSIHMRDALPLVGKSIRIRNVWPCKDGFVTFRLSFGQNVGMRNIRLTEWMNEEGMVGDLALVPWDYLSTLELDQSEVDGWQDTIQEFFLEKTKQQLYDGALDRRIMLFPVLDLSEMLSNEQLSSRQFFLSGIDPSIGDARWPGPFFRSGIPNLDPQPSRPPDLGQDSTSVLTELCGLDEESIADLTAKGIVTCL